jgi:PAS domain S-box-containing protein
LSDLEGFIAEVITTVREREREVQDKGGRWYSLRVRPYVNLDNKVDGAVLVMVDIDALKRTERVIAEAREHAEAIIRTVPDPLVILNADLGVHSANEAFYRTFKVSPAEAEGHALFELGNKQWNIPRLRHLLEDIVPRNNFFNDFEVTHEFERIGRRTLLLNARMLSEPDGKPGLILLGIRDITEVLAFQAELRQSEARKNAIFKSALDAVITMDHEGKLVEFNPAAEKMFGHSRTEAVGKPLAELIIPERLRERHKQGMARYLATGEGPILNRQIEMSALRADGTEFPAELSVIAVPGRQPPTFTAFLRDITERKQAEEALRLAQAQLADRAGQLEQAVAERTAELTATNKQLESLVYSIAHDLRAPLRAMQGFSSILVEEAGAALSESGRNFANRINRSAQFMDALLQDLLAFSRISQERIELLPVNLETVVQSALSRLEREMQEKHARMEISGPWPTVLAHDPTLGQVIFNLVSNALKFVRPEVLPLVRLRAEERIDGLTDKWISERSSTNPSIHSSIHPPLPPPPAAWVRVWVEDNGIGIAPEHQEQIFRLFARLHGDRYPGTGTGLAIVQKGLERMGGRVGLESTPGQGSRFWFELRQA